MSSIDAKLYVGILTKGNHDMFAITLCSLFLTTKIMSRVLSTTESLCVASSTSLQEKHMFCTTSPNK
jgi:hypothetical protein